MLAGVLDVLDVMLSSTNKQKLGRQSLILIVFAKAVPCMHALVVLLVFRLLLNYNFASEL